MIVISGISLYRGPLNPAGFCLIHYTVTLAGLKNVNRYIGNIVIGYIEDCYIGVPV